MKKIIYFLAAAAAVSMFASCDRQDGTKYESPLTEIEVAKEDLVLHLPFEDGSVAVGKGVSYDSKNGMAEFILNGFIGKCYSNTGGNSGIEAYLKYNLASDNFVNDLQSFTFSVWTKRTATGNGGVFSLNGQLPEATGWPRLCFFYDNNYEDGQEFKGRIDTTEGTDNPAFWPSVRATALAETDKWVHVVYTYDAETSKWFFYASGAEVAQGEFVLNEKPLGDLNVSSATMNALYVGGWSTFIEKQTTETWQTYFPGYLDELRIYKRALTAEEVGELYREEAVRAAEVY